MRRAVLLPLSLLLTVPAAGCRTVVTVDVQGEEDGSGEVTVTAELDAEAVTAVGGAEKIVLSDLAEAGWDVAEPGTDDSGALTLEATRSFTDGEELADVLDEIGGNAGGVPEGAPVFTDTAYEISDGFGSMGYEMTAVVSVTGDLSQFSDPALAEVLGGLPVGLTPEELAALGATEPGAGELVVRLAVPGGGSDEVSLDLTGAEPVEAVAQAEGSVPEPAVLALAIGGAVALLVGLVLLLRRGRAGG